MDKEEFKTVVHETLLANGFIKKKTQYYKENDQVMSVIVEGILYKHRYGEMLNKLIQSYNQNNYTYYFDLSFEETVIRHNSRTKKFEFGEDSLRSWWNPNDYLGVDGETLLTNEMSQNEVLKLILNQIQQ